MARRNSGRALGLARWTNITPCAQGIAVFGTDGRLKIHNASFARLWDLPEDSLKDNPRFSKLIEASLPLYHDTDFWDSLKARATDPNPD